MKRFYSSRAEHILSNAMIEIKRRNLAYKEIAGDKDITQQTMQSSKFDLNPASRTCTRLRDTKVLNWLSTIDEDAVSVESSDWRNGLKKINPSRLKQQESGLDKVNASEQKQPGTELRKDNPMVQKQQGTELDKVNPSVQKQQGTEPNKANPSKQKQQGTELEYAIPSSYKQQGTEPDKANPSVQQQQGTELHKVNPSMQKQQGTEPDKANPSVQKQQGTEPDKANPSVQKQQGTEPDKANPSVQKQQRTEPDKANPSVQKQQGTEPDKANPSVQKQQGTEPDKANPSVQKQQGTEPDKANPSVQKQQRTEPDKANPSVQKQQGTEPDKANPSAQQQQGTELDKVNLSNQKQQGTELEKFNPCLQKHKGSGLGKVGLLVQKQRETGLKEVNPSMQKTIIEKKFRMTTRTESLKGSKTVKQSLNDSDVEFSEDDDGHDADYVPDSDTGTEESSIIPVYSALSSPLGLSYKTSAHEDPDYTMATLKNNPLVKKKTCKRILRPCMFCSCMQTNLHRHIAVKHKLEEVVIKAFNLPKRDRWEAFARMRKEGISKHNRAQMKGEFPIYESERSGTQCKNLVQCGNCQGFYSKDYFARHRKLCMDDLAQEPKAMPLDLLADSFCNLKETFKTEILACFTKDNVGQLCKTDEMIRLFGSRMFEKLTGKTDKKAEVKRSVMSDMRRIAYLYLQFKQKCENAGVQVLSSSDMLSRKNFSYLEDAITEYTGTSSSRDGLKAGLKTALNYLIKRFLKVVKASYLIRDEDEKASEIDKFLEVFQLNQHHNFGDAIYKLNRNRQETLRRPAQLPSEANIEKIKQYTVERVTTLLQDTFLLWDTRAFTELRDLAVSRLTLFNARRGGEPARLRISEWLDAENNSWLDVTRAQHLENDVDCSLFHSMKVTFQGGKGNNHLVPVLFPLDIVPAMQKLVAVRDMVGIKRSNCYMFPCTQHSDTHVSGWHAVSRISTDASLENPERLTATKMRHRVSTLYAAMDVSENERQLFYKHMGHSASINANIYQAPLAEAEILQVGRCLQQMDGQVLRSTAPRNNMVDVSVTLHTPTHDHVIPVLNVGPEAHSAFLSYTKEVPLVPTEPANLPSNEKTSKDVEPTVLAPVQPGNQTSRDVEPTVLAPEQPETQTSRNVEPTVLAPEQPGTQTSKNVEPTVLAPEQPVTLITVQTVDGAKSVSKSHLLSRDNKAEPTATKNTKKHGAMNFKGRDYTRWSEHENMLIRQAFNTYIINDGLPSHGEILQFQEGHPEIRHSYKKIYIKVFNEQKTVRRRADRFLQSIQP